MSEEEKRHVAEGLDTEEQLAVFDMLLKPDLSKPEIKKVKSVAVSLLQELERQMLDVQGIFDKTATRDRFRQSIYDYLYDDRTGLPAESYKPHDWEEVFIAGKIGVRPQMICNTPKSFLNFTDMIHWSSLNFRT
ncbi:hypothetical protein N8A98_01850 (plasmid) [Devosia neptuniae]|uniref:Uncharacterized protein n=1 Tax=Devosia neptuniae TaxID=191302 RepID=A0ABY6C7J3_9HYPH|nr:hypothetical protein [Devosia neptuniae]UXN68209.1 hypothetical protein N8A98_01850 [Devosia neptuniae]